MKLLLTLVGIACFGVAFYFVQRAEKAHWTPKSNSSVEAEPAQQTTPKRTVLIFDGADSQSMTVRDKPQTAIDLPELAPMPRQQRDWAKVFFRQMPPNGMGVGLDEPDWNKNSPGAEALIRSLDSVLELRPTRELGDMKTDGLTKVAAQMARYPTLTEMPWQNDQQCDIAEATAKEYAEFGLAVRQSFASLQFAKRIDKPTWTEDNYVALWKTIQEKGSRWKNSRHAAKLLPQILQAEDAVLRMMLVEILDQLEGQQATAALARLAVFDVDERVRWRALERLQGRSHSDAIPVLLSGIRHIWPPAAANAADALIKLRARDALTHLAWMLDAPEPTAPFESPEHPNKPMIRELVRMNHNLNCVVCHITTPAAPRRDPITFNAPDPKRSLSPFPSTEYYSRDTAVLVRIDFTYLRQDFSVRMGCYDIEKWPTQQRYDFFVRTRPATSDEIRQAAEKRETTPHRDALLDALRGITGQDGGNDPAEWKRIVANINRD